MNRLQDLAAQIRLAKQTSELVRESIEEKRVNDYCATVVAAFEKAFDDELPLLKEAGITYHAEMNDRRYEFKGVYIRFEKQEVKPLKMDFVLSCTSGGAGWRYEHVEYGGYMQSCYGHWPKEDFVSWIANHFFPE